MNIWNNHIFELRIKIELYEDHRSEGVSTKAVEKKKPEQIQAWTGIETHELCDTAAPSKNHFYFFLQMSKLCLLNIPQAKF